MFCIKMFFIHVCVFNCGNQNKFCPRTGWLPAVYAISPDSDGLEGMFFGVDYLSVRLLVCLPLSRIAKNWPTQFLWTLMAGCSIGQGRTHYSMEQIRGTGWLHGISFHFANVVRYVWKLVCTTEKLFFAICESKFWVNEVSQNFKLSISKIQVSKSKFWDNSKFWLSNLKFWLGFTSQEALWRYIAWLYISLIPRSRRHKTSATRTTAPSHEWENCQLLSAWFYKWWNSYFIGWIVTSKRSLERIFTQEPTLARTNFERTRMCSFCFQVTKKWHTLQSFLIGTAKSKFWVWYLKISS